MQIQNIKQNSSKQNINFQSCRINFDKPRLEKLVQDSLLTDSFSSTKPNTDVLWDNLMQIQEKFKNDKKIDIVLYLEEDFELEGDNFVRARVENEQSFPPTAGFLEFVLLDGNKLKADIFKFLNVGQ